MVKIELLDFAKKSQAKLMLSIQPGFKPKEINLLFY